MRDGQLLPIPIPKRLSGRAGRGLASVYCGACCLMKKRSRKPDPEANRPRFLFVGEGPHDIGRAEHPGGALRGFLCAVLCGPCEPIAHHEAPFEIGRIEKWTQIDLQSRPATITAKPRSFDELLKPTTDGERVRAVLLLAATLELDGVVLMRDCERPNNIGLGDMLRQAGREYAKR